MTSCLFVFFPIANWWLLCLPQVSFMWWWPPLMSFRQARSEPSHHARSPTLREYQMSCQISCCLAKGDNIVIPVWEKALSENKVTAGQLLQNSIFILHVGLDDYGKNSNLDYFYWYCIPDFFNTIIYWLKEHHAFLSIDSGVSFESCHLDWPKYNWTVRQRNKL